MMDEPTALLLIAHGSREPAANDDLRRLADELRAHRPVCRGGRGVPGTGRAGYRRRRRRRVSPPGANGWCWYRISSRRVFMCVAIWRRRGTGLPRSFRPSSSGSPSR